MKRSGQAKFKEIDASKPIPIFPGKSCGSCDACCTTVPVSEIGLKAYTRCPNLRGMPDMRPGCSIYPTRPGSCMRWSCSWLTSDLPDEFRPDRFGVVIDPIPDMIRFGDKELPAAQFWVLPGHEDDWQREEVHNLLMQVLDQGACVLWRIRGDKPGMQKARVFGRVPKDLPLAGSQFMTDAVYGEEQISGFETDGERLHHAQGLVRSVPG